MLILSAFLLFCLYTFSDKGNEVTMECAEPAVLGFALLGEASDAHGFAGSGMIILGF